MCPSQRLRLKSSPCCFAIGAVRNTLIIWLALLALESFSSCSTSMRNFRFSKLELIFSTLSGMFEKSNEYGTEQYSVYICLYSIYIYLIRGTPFTKE